MLLESFIPSFALQEEPSDRAPQTTPEASSGLSLLKKPGPCSMLVHVSSLKYQLPQQMLLPKQLSTCSLNRAGPYWVVPANLSQRTAMGKFQSDTDTE